MSYKMIYFILFITIGYLFDFSKTQITENVTEDNIESHNSTFMTKWMCLNNYKEPFPSDCSSSHSDDEIENEEISVCDFYQMKRHLKSNGCPPGFDLHSTRICYLMTEPTSWQDKCLKFGSSMSYNNYWADALELLKEGVISETKFWIPAKKYDNFQQIMWRLPGINWGAINSYMNTDIIFDNDKNCSSFMYENNGWEIVMENCNLQLPTLCLHPINDGLFLQLACPESTLTTRFEQFQDMCFNILPKQKMCNELLRPLSEEKTLLYQQLPKDNVKNASYCQVSLSEIVGNFTNWSENSKEHCGEYTTIDQQGNWYKSETLTCNACEQKIELKKPQLHLKFTPNRKPFSLILTVYNFTYLWTDKDDLSRITCFRTEDGEDDKKLVRIVNKTILTKKGLDVIKSKRMYGIHVTDEHESYWCEGHVIPNFDVIKTPPIEIHTSQYKPLEFAAIFKLTVIVEESELTQRIDEIQNYLKIITDNIVRKINLKFKSKEEIVFHIEVSGRIVDIINDHLPRHIDTQYQCLVWLNKYLYKETDLYSLVTFRSLHYCLPESLEDLDYGTNGSFTSLRELCLTENNLPQTKVCRGDMIYGLKWVIPIGKITNCKTEKITEQTRQLFKISKSEIRANETFEICNIMAESTSHPEQISKTDIVSIRDIVTKIHTLTEDNIALMNKIEIEKLTQIMSNILHMNKSMIQENQVNEASGTIGMIANKVLTNELKKISLTETTIKNISFFQPKYQIHVLNPEADENRITGMALYRNISAEGIGSGFTHYYTTFLKSTQSIDELLLEPNLEMAVFTPEDLLVELLATSDADISAFRIVISTLWDDHFYQEKREIALTKPDSRIFAIEIPDFPDQLPSHIPIIFKALDGINNLENVKCGFWELSSENETQSEIWSDKGCFVDHVNFENSLVVCKCEHLTPFSLFLEGAHLTAFVEGEKSGNYIQALNYITIIGCSLSLLGILGILITAIVFKVWTQKTGTKILLHLSIAIGFQMILLLLSNTNVLPPLIEATSGETTITCLIMSICFHFSALTIFLWMLIITYFQFMRFVRVLYKNQTSRLVLKSSLIGWILPMIIVVILASTLPNQYQQYSTSSETCYPTDDVLIYGVLCPIGIIILVNIVIFFLILKNIFDNRFVTNRSRQRKAQMAKVRLTILLFFLLGLTWTFGFLMVFSSGILRKIFEVIFCIMASMQGFVLFIYFVILDPFTRQLYSYNLMKLRQPQSKTESSIINLERYS